MKDFIFGSFSLFAFFIFINFVPEYLCQRFLYNQNDNTKTISNLKSNHKNLINYHYKFQFFSTIMILINLLLSYLLWNNNISQVTYGYIILSLLLYSPNIWLHIF